MRLAEKEHCTSCGACAYVCAKCAIRFVPNSIGETYPVIDPTLCVECGKCRKVCPSLNPVEKQLPMKAYAAWHNDTNERLMSASGGIAAAAYQIALEKGMDIAGAIQNEDFSVDIVVSDKLEAIGQFRNSKYVFSGMDRLYPRLKRNIDQGKRTLVIALPCQIAAIRRCFPDHRWLVLADVVCHGTTPLSYLQQHIHHIESLKGKKAVMMYFRDPFKYTYTYTFTLYDQAGDCFYAKRTVEGDTYNIGYHRVISYRNNCFNCQYAEQRRVGDFTLCDYSGLGAKYPFAYNPLNTSCILVNTAIGKSFIQSLIDSKLLSVFERPIDEPVSGNSQLQKPCAKSKARLDFERYIVRYEGDFERAMKAVIARREKRERRAAVLRMPLRIVRKMGRVVKSVLKS